MADCSIFVLWDAHKHLAMMENRPDLGPGGTYYVYPGGKLEPGETPEQAALRECREEAGVTPEQWVELSGPDMNAGYNRYSPDQSNWRTFAYLVTKWSGELNVRSSEHAYGDFQWLDPGAFHGEPDGFTCVREIAERISAIAGPRPRPTTTVFVVRYPGDPLTSFIQAAESPVEAVALAIVQQKASEREGYVVWDWSANSYAVAHEQVDAFLRSYHKEPA